MELEKCAGEIGTVTKTVTVFMDVKKMVSRLGFDPSTLALKGRCSTE